MIFKLLLVTAFFGRGVADILTLIAVGRNASSSVSRDPRSGYATFQPFGCNADDPNWCSDIKTLDLPQAKRISATLSDRITDRLKQQRGEFSCAALSYRSLPSFVWIETDPKVLPTLSQLRACNFPHDCLNALEGLPKDHWTIVPNTSVEHDFEPVQGRFWLANTRLLPGAVNPNKYYHCVVERAKMCEQSPLAIEANHAFGRPALNTACEPRNRTVCAPRLQKGKTDDFCPSLNSVQPVMDDPAAYGCHKQVADLICRYLFDSKFYRENCYLDKLTACEVSWKILDEKYHTLWFWPRCEDLPSSRLPNVIVTDQRKTVRNRPCQPWKSQCPIEHNFLPEIYPTIVGSDDHCVSINGDPPICIDSMANINDDPATWSTKLGRCSGDSHVFLMSGKEENVETAAVIHGGSKPTVASSTWAIWLVVCASIALGTVLVLKTCAKRPKSAIELATAAAGDSHLVDDRRWLRRNDLYYETRTGGYGGAAAEAPMDLIRSLSAGAHGTVYLARLEGEFVAVKMIKRADGGDGAYVMFAYEGWALRQIGDHENIVKLLAVRTEPVDCLVFEFMPCCDLKNMLRYCNNEPVEGLDTIRYDRSSLTNADLMKILLQILDGAAFIASQGWIHRDLAARNCLVGHGLVVKIGDFGLCRRANASGSFLAESSGEVAVRWAAPEVLLDRRYSFASDVWAAAVLVWEIFTMGQMPFYGLSASEVSDAVLHGTRLSKPDRCPDPLWNLIATCFADDENLRPTFAQLTHSLI